MPDSPLSPKEQARIAGVMKLVPEKGGSVLDLGAREGHFSLRLVDRFERVTAVDLNAPRVSHPRISCCVGDATALGFASKSFDCVFCTEVLEHIPRLRLAAAEIARVARSQIILGVPFEQDTRIGRATCRSCNGIGPPYNHVNTFDLDDVTQLFAGFRLVETSFAGSTRDTTNRFSVWLMDLAGNPWGVYMGNCVHCGRRLEKPDARMSLGARILCAVAIRLNRLQERFEPPRPVWIHARFERAGD